MTPYIVTLTCVVYLGHYGGPWISSWQAFNLVSFEQSHHKPMWLYAGGTSSLSSMDINEPSAYVSVGLWWTALMKSRVYKLGEDELDGPPMVALMWLVCSVTVRTYLADSANWTTKWSQNEKCFPLCLNNKTHEVAFKLNDSIFPMCDINQAQVRFDFMMSLQVQQKFTWLEGAFTDTHFDSKWFLCFPVFICHAELHHF